MPCRNTSQLINVKSFRKTPHVPFTYSLCLYPFLWSTLHPIWTLKKTDLKRERETSTRQREVHEGLQSAVCSYLCPHCTLHFTYSISCRRGIMMANYAISKGLSLVSVRRPCDRWSQSILGQNESINNQPHVKRRVRFEVVVVTRSRGCSRSPPPE